MALKIREKLKLILYSVIIAAVVLVVFKFSYLIENNGLILNFISDYGYGGIFLVSFVGGFNFLVPVPAISFLPLFLIAGLNIWLATLFIILGITLADSITYIIGAIGKRVVIRSTVNRYIFQRLEEMRRRHYWMPVIVLFLFAAFVPFPNEVIMVSLGFLGYRFTHLLPALFVGNSVFNILYVLGIVNLFKI